MPRVISACENEILLAALKRDGRGGWTRKREKETERKRETERALQIKFYTEKKSSLLVRRKKLRLKIPSGGRRTLSASARKGGGGRLPQGKIEYEANATNEERLKHSHQFLSSPLITDVASSSMLIPVKQCLWRHDTFIYCCIFPKNISTRRNQIIILKIFKEFSY